MSFDSGWIARVTLSAQSPALQVVNTLHYEGDDPLLGSPASLQSLANRLRDDLLVPYRAIFDNTFVIGPVIVTEEVDPLNPDAPREQRAAGTPANGTRSTTSERLPTAVALVATELTAFVGRSFRGRLFLGGMTTESDQNGGNWSTVAGSHWTLCGNFLDAIPLQPDLVFGPSAATVRYVVYSRTRRARAQSPYFAPVTSHQRRSRLHWLRSRQSET